MSELTRDAELSPGAWGETWMLGPGPLIPPRKPYPMAPGAPSSLQLLHPQRERGSVSLGWHRPLPPGQATLPRPPNESDPGLCDGLETPARGRAPEQVQAHVRGPARPAPSPPSAGSGTNKSGEARSPRSFLGHSAFLRPAPWRPSGVCTPPSRGRYDLGPRGLRRDHICTLLITLRSLHKDALSPRPAHLGWTWGPGVQKA